MPFYDYKCTSCGKEQEEFHSMSDEPDVVCKECGEPMKKTVNVGHGGFKMIKDGTRRRDYKTRYGGTTRKSDNTATPSESAHAKAVQQMNERIAKKKDPDDPYAGLH
jgi:putative FmdB family regulatory protein